MDNDISIKVLKWPRDTRHDDSLHNNKRTQNNT